MSGDCPFCPHHGAFDSGYTGGDMAKEAGMIFWKVLTDPGQLLKSGLSAAPVGHKGRCPNCRSKVIFCAHCGHANPYRTADVEWTCKKCTKICQI